MRPFVSVLMAGLLVVAACGADSESADSPEVVPSETSASTEPSLEVVDDVEYLVTESGSLLLDVYRPDGAGPWPVVVMYHGAGREAKDGPVVTTPATTLAEGGFLVFAPTWASIMGIPTVDGWQEDMRDAACALAYAQQVAPEYGGDPERLATFGGSAGAHPAAWMALGHAEPAEGCLAEGNPSVPNGAILVDSEYFQHTQVFQPMFDDEPERAREIVTELIDSATWSLPAGATFRLSAAGSQTTESTRQIEDPYAEDSWLARRDTDGNLVNDLTGLGALDDDSIDFIDAGRLLNLRLERAGVDATYETHAGVHFDVIANMDPEYLLAAATETTAAG